MEGVKVIRTFDDNDRNLHVSLSESSDGVMCIDLHFEDIDLPSLVFSDLLKIALKVYEGDYNYKSY